MIATDFLTPINATDKLVILGSGAKLHVVEKAWIDLNASSGLTITARCGRRGRKVRDHLKGRLPENTSETHAVCHDCREFCRGVDG